jgi:hypothetical protein
MTRFISKSARRSRFTVAGCGLLALATLGAMLTLAGSSAAASPTTVGLGTAGNFAVLAGSAITDVPTSSLTGNVGLSPTTGGAITGLTCAEVTGTIYSVDAAGPLPCRKTNPALLTTAKNDLTAAYINAAGRTPDTTFGAADNQLGGKTLVPGVYAFGHAATANLIGNLTLKGDGNAVWIFQASSDLVFAGSSTVHFSGGAQACNVFWQVTSSATLGTSSSISGTILALTSITAAHGATISGRLLAQNGNVTLDDNTIVRPTCASSGGSSQPPGRALYCGPDGKTYDLVKGEDKEPPYDALNLVPAYVDPVTGSQSCDFPAAVTTTATTTATTTTTVQPPTPVTPAPTPKPKPPAHKAKGVKAAKQTHVVHVAPRPAKHTAGFTG